MLSQKSFKVFKHSLRAVLPLIVAIVLVCLCGFYDIFGYEKRIPETSEIESIRYSDNYLNTTTKDPEMIVMIRDLHESVINTEAEEDVEFEGDIISQSIYISYHLKNGNTVERYYSYMTDNFESVAEVEQKIDALWSSDAAKRTVIECLTSTERFDYFSIYNMQDTEEYYNDGYINAQALVQALVTDMKNGDDISFKWTESSVWSVDFSADGFYISFYFDDGFENTMEYLNAVKSIRDSVENSVSYD